MSSGRSSYLANIFDLSHPAPNGAAPRRRAQDGAFSASARDIRATLEIGFTWSDPGKMILELAPAAVWNETLTALRSGRCGVDAVAFAQASEDVHKLIYGRKGDDYAR